MINSILKNNYKPVQKFYIFVVIIFSIFFSFASISQASTEIYFNNNAKEVFVGDSFSVDLMISSPDKSINVIDGTILYDKNILEIKKVKTEDSVLSLWTEEPSFNNEKGELSFVGGIPNGFTGKEGQILEINFLAKKDGTSLVSFQDIFSVFLNDGKGTQINPWLKPLSLDIKQKPIISLPVLFKNIFLKSMNYLWIFILLLLFVIIILFIKKKKNEK